VRARDLQGSVRLSPVTDPRPPSPVDRPTTTSVTLLGRLRDPADAEAWREFDARYRELILWFLRRRGLQIADAEDVAQSVIAKLIGGLRTFEYDRDKQGFRAYLYRCARSALADFGSRQKSAGRAVAVHGNALSSPDAEGETFAAFEREWVNHHYRMATRRFRAETDGRGGALLEATIAGTTVREIAAELSMTEAAVYKAQQRLRDRLEELIAQQLRDEDPEYGWRAHHPPDTST
jgi:RNA polymerase sigma factor (sigma-70 family)